MVDCPSVLDLSHHMLSRFRYLYIFKFQQFLLNKPIELISLNS